MSAAQKSDFPQIGIVIQDNLPWYSAFSKSVRDGIAKINVFGCCTPSYQNTIMIPDSELFKPIKVDKNLLGDIEMKEVEKPFHK